MTNIEKIRAALESLKWRVLEVERQQVDEALAALAALERAAAEPVKFLLYIDGTATDRTITPPVSAGHMPPGIDWRPLYAAPPPAPVVPGMFTAADQKRAYYDGRSGAAEPSSDIAWDRSVTRALIKDRTP